MSRRSSSSVIVLERQHGPRPGRGPAPAWSPATRTPGRRPPRRRPGPSRPGRSPGTARGSGERGGGPAPRDPGPRRPASTATRPRARCATPPTSPQWYRDACAAWTISSSWSGVRSGSSSSVQTWLNRSMASWRRAAGSSPMAVGVVMGTSVLSMLTRSRWPIRCETGGPCLDGRQVATQDGRPGVVGRIGRHPGRDPVRGAGRATGASRCGGRPRAGPVDTVDSPSPGRPRPGAAGPARRSGGGHRWSDRSCARTVRWTPGRSSRASLDPRATRESRGSRGASAAGLDAPGRATQSRSAQRVVSRPMPDQGSASGRKVRTSSASGVGCASPPTIRAS